MLYYVYVFVTHSELLIMSSNQAFKWHFEGPSILVDKWSIKVEHFNSEIKAWCTKAYLLAEVSHDEAKWNERRERVSLLSFQIASSRETSASREADSAPVCVAGRILRASASTNLQKKMSFFTLFVSFARDQWSTSPRKQQQQQQPLFALYIYTPMLLNKEKKNIFLYLIKPGASSPDKLSRGSPTC